jgi:DNA-binding SARP family transcriptional activator
MTESHATLLLFGGIDLTGLDPAAADKVLVQDKAVAALAFLAVQAAGTRGRRFQRRDRLAGLLWPELDQTRARAALRKTVHFIRAALGAESIVSRGDEELALGETVLRCDVAEFVEAVERNRLARALELYRDDLMPGFHLTDCGEFERWLEEWRVELRQQAAASAWAMAKQSEDDKNLTLADKWATLAARYSRDNERVLRRTMTMLDRLGNRAGALALYEEFAQTLHKELDAKPSPESVALATSLRGH